MRNTKTKYAVIGNEVFMIEPDGTEVIVYSCTSQNKAAEVVRELRQKDQQEFPKQKLRVK